MNSFSSDASLNGKIRVKQSCDGYRFSIDALILAAQADQCPGKRMLDLGTGCGIIPLIMAYRDPERICYGVEVQQSLAHLATLNVAANDMTQRITILSMDMRNLTPNHLSGRVDLVVTNPPYRKQNSGRINPHAERAIARHEIRVTLVEVLQSAYHMLRSRGQMVASYPAERLADMIAGMRFVGIEPKYLRMVQDRIDREATRILIQGTRGGKPGMHVATPLIIRRDDGSYTEEVERMLAP